MDSSDLREDLNIVFPKGFFFATQVEFVDSGDSSIDFGGLDVVPQQKEEFVVVLAFCKDRPVNTLLILSY